MTKLSNLSTLATLTLGLLPMIALVIAPNFSAAAGF
mgnify:CR=1 FL=1